MSKVIGKLTDKLTDKLKSSDSPRPAPASPSAASASDASALIPSSSSPAPIVLADGTKQAAGQLHTGSCRVRQGAMKWQSTGVLTEGCCLPGESPTMDRQGWTIELGGPGQHLDQKGRQRTELLSWPPSDAGDTWVYKWRFHLKTGCASSYKFFHLVQVLSREQGGFVVALGLVNGRVKISSIFPLPSGEELPSIPADEFWGRTTFHRCAVKWGDAGFVDYQIRDAMTNELLLLYKVEGVKVPAQGSIKTGLYRAVPAGPAAAVVGDFDFFKK